MARRKQLSLPPSRPEVIAFLRDIKDDPDDDIPRLILADWLEDRGDPRGLFVRLQVEAACLPRNDPRHPQFSQQIDALRKQHQATWVGKLSRKGLISFERGLMRLRVNQLWFLGPTWQALADTETWEWAEEVMLSGIDDRALIRLAESPLLSSVSSLKFCDGGQLSSTSYATLLASSVVSNLRLFRPLDYPDSAPNETARIISSSPALARLAALDLRHCRTGPETAVFLATSSILGNLTKLDLRNLNHGSTGIGPAGARALADSPFLGRLREVLLAGNTLTNEGVGFLATSPHLEHLESLDLSCNLITDAGVETLASSRHLAGLRWLHLNDNQLGPRAAQALANCSGLSQLRSLSINHCGLSNESIRALVEGTGLPALTALNVNLKEDDANLRAAVLRRFPISWLDPIG